MPGKSIKEAELDGDKRALLITRSEVVKSPHGYGGSAQLYLVAEVEAALVTLAEVDQLAPTEASAQMAALAKTGKAQVKEARLVRRGPESGRADTLRSPSASMPGARPRAMPSARATRPRTLASRRSAKRRARSS